MNIRSLLFAGVLCVLGMIGEGLYAGKGANATLRTLKQPRWALPVWGWYCLGLVYYTACFVTLYRVSQARDATVMRTLGLGLVIAVMIANVAWNYIFFRQKNLALSYRYLLPYSVLVLALLYTVTQVDSLSAILFLLYALYLPYAIAWTFRVWKLNL